MTTTDKNNELLVTNNELKKASSTIKIPLGFSFPWNYLWAIMEFLLPPLIFITPVLFKWYYKKTHTEATCRKDLLKGQHNNPVIVDEILKKVLDKALWFNYSRTFLSVILLILIGVGFLISIGALLYFAAHSLSWHATVQFLIGFLIAISICTVLARLVLIMFLDGNHDNKYAKITMFFGGMGLIAAFNPEFEVDLNKDFGYQLQQKLWEEYDTKICNNTEWQFKDNLPRWIYHKGVIKTKEINKKIVSIREKFCNDFNSNSNSNPLTGIKISSRDIDIDKDCEMALNNTLKENIIAKHKQKYMGSHTTIDDKNYIIKVVDGKEMQLFINFRQDKPPFCIAKIALTAACSNNSQLTKIDSISIIIVAMQQYLDTSLNDIIWGLNNNDYFDENQNVANSENKCEQMNANSNNKQYEGNKSITFFKLNLENNSSLEGVEQQEQQVEGETERFRKIS